MERGTLNGIMIETKNIALSPHYVELHTENGFEGSVALSLYLIKKYSSKLIFAVITFLVILFFEKSLKEAWLIPSLATMVFVVPFIEEFGKFIALKYRFTGFFLVIFLGIESYLFISHLGYFLGWNKIILCRILVCAMHITTVYFQWIARVYSEKLDKQHHVTAAYFLSVFFHGAWNYGL